MATDRPDATGRTGEKQVMAALARPFAEALDGGGLALAFQPVAAASHGGVVGYEALLRWHHAGEAVPPGTILALARRAGQMPALSVQVLERGLLAARDWPPHVRLCVNLAPSEVAHPEVLAALHAALATLPAGRLQIEVTEDRSVPDPGAMRAALQALRGAGLLVAIDDFGIDFSSLWRLKNFPFSHVKIDQAFVADLQESAASRAIVRAILGLCRELRLTATAEGVETDAQRAFLRAEGCAELQGYLVGRPQPWP
jgi:EAL domain-containing protein (putative c-di-GMP-specific phosphodiesterase class I)